MDGTAFLGPVGLNGAVQAQFTTSPQYFSFGFQVAADDESGYGQLSRLVAVSLPQAGE